MFLSLMFSTSAVLALTEHQKHPLKNDLNLTHSMGKVGNVFELTRCSRYILDVDPSSPPPLFHPYRSPPRPLQVSVHSHTALQSRCMATRKELCPRRLVGQSSCQLGSWAHSSDCVTLEEHSSLSLSHDTTFSWERPSPLQVGWLGSV